MTFADFEAFCSFLFTTAGRYWTLLGRLHIGGFSFTNWLLAIFSLGLCLVAFKSATGVSGGIGGILSDVKSQKEERDREAEKEARKHGG